VVSENHVAEIARRVHSQRAESRTKVLYCPQATPREEGARIVIAAQELAELRG
jgi:hypothetical protein